jgi:ribonuclease VapC
VFIDTSALVAVVLQEPAAEQIKLLIERSTMAFTSPMVRLETSIVLAQKLDISISAAEKHFDNFLIDGKIKTAPLSDEIGKLAVEAYAKYGKGRHPARLNLADCYSYAVAKSLGVKILFVGDDFSKTDLKSALL